MHRIIQAFTATARASRETDGRLQAL